MFYHWQVLSACSNTAGQSQNAEDTSDSTADTEGTADEKIPLKISHHPYIHALPSVYAEENGLYDMFDYTIDMYASGPVQNEAIAAGHGRLELQEQAELCWVQPAMI